MMMHLEILQAAKARIADPSNWTTVALARFADGRPVISNDWKEWKAKGTKFCALGAVYSVTDWNNSSNAEKYLWTASDELFKCSPIYCNDTLGHDSVMKMFDRAIELANDA